MNFKQCNVLVSLTSSDSDYQVAMAKAAQEAARVLNMKVNVIYADNDAITQSQQLLKVIQTPALRPDGIVFEPVGTGLVNVARAAVNAGIGWVIMNRKVDYIDELRRLGKAPVFAVTNDHLEIGRLLGRQLNELLPDGGGVLCIQGPASSDSAQNRTTGMKETLRGNIQVRYLFGHWTENSAFETVNSWLRLSTSREVPLKVVAAQNDLMAMGARKAFAQHINDGNGRWENLRFLGVDGLPDHGQSWVRSGVLSATVVVPSITTNALEMLSKALNSGIMPPERTIVSPVSFPPIESLAHKAFL
jgi:ABC-type sugar transport system substrate-binding protein